MAAIAPVTTVTVPPPPAGGNAGPTQQSAPGPASPSNVPASEPVISTSDAAKVILAQPAPPPAPAPSQSRAPAAFNPAPSALQIQAELSTVLITLDNLPEEHPNSPAVVLLQNKESALRDALTQVLLEPGPGLAYLSGVVLNAAV
ncbi:MAG TPA: hypothetical protein VN905_05215 [Candidatus Binatia bacterium]|nr:hypothetical protein [Candidatus Binatia bacterium]